MHTIRRFLVGALASVATLLGTCAPSFALFNSKAYADWARAYGPDPHSATAYLVYDQQTTIRFVSWVHGVGGAMIVGASLLAGALAVLGRPARRSRGCEEAAAYALARVGF